MPYTYFAADGNFGDAQDLILVDTDTFQSDDWDYLLNLSDSDRSTEAYAMAVNRDRIAGDAVVVPENERAQMNETLEAVITFLTRSGAYGWAEELGDIRDVINRMAVK